MLMRFALFALSILSLSACSSSGGRAPVSDVTLGENNNPKSSYATKWPAQKGAIKGNTYTVQKGDTLYSIGWRSGVGVSDLINHNNLKKPYIIKAGQIVKLRKIKVNVAQKKVDKSDLAQQNEKNNRPSPCKTPNCQKNQPKRVAPENTKAYSKVRAGKKIAITNDSAVKASQIKNKKVGDWSWPVKGKLTKQFSDSPSGMQGVSIVNVQGSLIRSTASGQVVYAGSGLRGYGNLIIIKHNYDYLSAYAHNETLLVKENQLIKKGQIIAKMGDSGTDHVHLHFEIRYRGKSVDPLRYLPKQ